MRGRCLMKKFWIVKHGPHGGVKERRLKPHDNFCYDLKNDADDVAKKHACHNRCLMVVLEVVSAFEPACDVNEVPIED